MAKTFTLDISEAELRNITHGLQKLYKELSQNLNEVNVATEGANNLKAYYKEKMQEVHTQLKQYNNLLTT